MEPVIWPNYEPLLTYFILRTLKTCAQRLEFFTTNTDCLIRLSDPMSAIADMFQIWS